MRNFLLILFVFLSCSFSVFAIGVIDQTGELVHLVNNPSPKISVSLNNTAEPMLVHNATLNVNSTIYSIDIGESLGYNYNRTFEFTLPNFGLTRLESHQENYFKLLVVGDVSGKEIQAQGDRLNFKVVYDDSVPNVTNYVLGYSFYLVGNDTQVDFDFSERIESYKVYVNGVLFSSEVFSSEFLSGFEDSLSVNFSSLNVGNNVLRIEFSDLAGNLGVFTGSIAYRGDSLKVKLLTKADSSVYPYFYNSSVPSLFSGTIYSTQRQFDLSVKTNYRANCYFADNLLNFVNVDLASDKVLMDSVDKLTHKVPVDLNQVQDSGLWVACVNEEFDDDVDYLSLSMNLGRNLFKIEHYDADYQIVDFLPTGVISYSPFGVSVGTTQKAVCTETISDTDFTSSDYLTHQIASFAGVSGNNNFNVVCYDVVYNMKSYSTSVNVDLTLGTGILGYYPKYISSLPSTVYVNFSAPADCKYSFNMTPVSQFNSLTSLGGSGLYKNLQVDSMTQDSTQNVYIYCSDGVSVKLSGQLELVYSPNGPQISNLTYYSSGQPSSFLKNRNMIDLGFGVDSFLPISYYNVKFNNGLTYNFTSNRFSRTLNLANASFVEVYGVNSIGVKGNVLTKQLLFDEQAPYLTYSSHNGALSLSCNDAGSGCERVIFGFSMSEFSCSENVVYGNSSVNFGSYLYFCAKAYDEVGNVNSTGTLRLDGLGSSSSGGGSSSSSSGGSSSGSGTGFSTSSSSGSGYDPEGDDDDDGIKNGDEFDKDGDGQADDTDRDGIYDMNDPDDDGDGVPTEDEYDVDGDGVADDSDGDGIADYLDRDDDNDGVPTEDEYDNVGDGVADDSDGDGIADYLDNDSDRSTEFGVDLSGDDDKDSVLNKFELDRNGDGQLEDTDGDGIPDYLDSDDDGDTLSTIDEFDKNGDGLPDDSDKDGIADYLDRDDDNDGHLTKDEYDANGDGVADDTNSNGILAYLDNLEPGRDGAFGGTYTNIDPNGDEDKDGILNKDEVKADVDGDGLLNYQDDDDNGNGILTKDEYDRDGDGIADDSDGDGTPDYLEVEVEKFPGDEFEDKSTGDDSLPQALDGFETDDGENSSSNWYILAALALLLLGISGGGYYAYNKGYLDDELEKLGVRPKNAKVFEGNKEYYKSPEVGTSGVNLNSNSNAGEAAVSVSSSNYDESLAKLNNFIDEKVGTDGDSSSRDLFEKFDDDSHKGNVEGYEDTLLKDKVGEKVSNMDVDEFDDYFKASKSSGQIDAEKDLEKQAEDFESFYEEKKKVDDAKSEDLGKTDDKKTK